MAADRVVSGGAMAFSAIEARVGGNLGKQLVTRSMVAAYLLGAIRVGAGRSRDGETGFNLKFSELSAAQRPA